MGPVLTEYDSSDEPILDSDGRPMPERSFSFGTTMNVDGTYHKHCERNTAHVAEPKGNTGNRIGLDKSLFPSSVAGSIQTACSKNPQSSISRKGSDVSSVASGGSDDQ